MELAAFIGTFDKKDLLLNIAKVLTKCGSRVLIIDATLMQRLKYIVPKISNNSITYISEFSGIDVALGFVNLESIAQYLGTNNSLPYDYVLIDTDNLQTMNSFMITRIQKIFLVTSYERYDAKRTIELLKYFNQPIGVLKVVMSPDIEDSQEEYFDKTLLTETPVRLNEIKVEFADTEEDRKAVIQNQLLGSLNLKHYTSIYKDSLEYITSLVAEGKIEQSLIKKMIRKN